MILTLIQYNKYTRFWKDLAPYTNILCLNSPNNWRNVSIWKIIERQSNKLEELNEFISSVKEEIDLKIG